ncbi:hypothetical protein [Cupriavidus sp. 8B]
MAIKAGLNANQLRRWIEQYKAEQEDAAGTMDVIENAPAAFIPVVEVHGADPQAEPERPTMSRPVLARALHCRRGWWRSCQTV